ncbi:MAG: translocation/assembly module TamB domain-containing protein [Candidatus Muiribacteriota bacterium]
MAVLLVFFSFLYSGEIENFFISEFKQQISNLEKYDVNINYSSLSYNFFQIILKDVEVEYNNSFLLKGQKVTLKPDLRKLFTNFKFIPHISIYNGKSRVDLKKESELSFFNEIEIGKIDYFNIDLTVNNIYLHNEYKNIKFPDSSGLINTGIFVNDFFSLSNSEINIETSKTGQLYSGNIKIKDGDVVEYETFLKEFENFKFIKGVFDAQIKYTVNQEGFKPDGTIFFKNVNMKHSEYDMVDITNYNGKIKLDDNIRFFIDNSVFVNGKKINFSGVKKRYQYIEITFIPEFLENGFLKINGKEGSYNYEGEGGWGDFSFRIINNRISFNYSELINGGIYINSNLNNGNFFLDYKNDINIWGDLAFCSEEMQIKSNNSFLRYKDSQYLFNINYKNEVLNIESPELFLMNFDKNTSLINGEFFLNQKKQVFEGRYSAEKNLISLQNSSGFLKIPLDEIKKTKFDYNLILDEIIFDKFKASNIDLSLKYNEEFELNGEAGKISYNDFIFKNIKITSNNIFNKISFKNKHNNLNLFVKEDKWEGTLKNYSYTFSVGDKTSYLFINKGNIKYEGEKIKIIPEKAHLEFKENIFNYISGNIYICSQKGIYSDNMILKRGKDKVNISFSIKNKDFDYNIKITGNEPYNINDFLQIVNKNINIKGTNNNYNGIIELEEASVDLGEKHPFGGRLILNNNILNISEIKVLNNQDELMVSGYYDYIMDEFDLEVEVENDTELDIANNNFSFLGQINGILNVSKRNNNYILGGALNINGAKLNVKGFKDLYDKINLKELALKYNKLEIDYKKNFLICEGEIKIKDKKSIDKFNNRVVSGEVDFLGNTFDIYEGRIQIDNSDFSPDNKKIKFNHNNKLNTEYRVNLKDYSFSNNKNTYLNNSLWLNVVLKKKIEDNTIFVRVSGNNENRNIMLYSEPELNENEIMELLKRNSVFSFFEASDNKERFLRFLGMEKNLLKRFTQEFNFDSVDLKGESSSINLNIIKKLSPDFTMNYEVGLSEEKESLGLRYRVGENIFIEHESAEKENNLKLKWNLNF